jgi:8-oxo-dGTP pyrophosphatase MutT (NUDIX family)
MTHALTSRDLQGNVYDVATSELSWRPSAYGIVIRDNKILLVIENEKYHLPGGGIELGENPAEAVLREVKEETGVTAESARLLDMASSLFSFGAYDTPPDLQHVHSLLIYYACEYVSEDAADKHLDAYEVAAGLRSEWVDVSMLDDITVGTTVDWRPVVRRLSR